MKNDLKAKSVGFKLCLNDGLGYRAFALEDAPEK
jgi:hypothetical protein